MSSPFWTFNYLPSSCPCKDCKKRTINCHGKCKEYAKWQKQKEKARNDYNERMRRS